MTFLTELSYFSFTVFKAERLLTSSLSNLKGKFVLKIKRWCFKRPS